MKTKNAIIAALVVLLLGAFLFGLYQVKSHKTTTSIFYESIESVVEVKAVTGAQESFGTAVFMDAEGTLVTNAHVVTLAKHGERVGYDEICIRFAQEEEYRQVTLLAFDENRDLALLHYDAGDEIINGIPMGDNETVEFGDTVYAIGNSMNTGLAISQGIISIPHINIEYDGKTRECIQADVTISNGNSGGALLDANGRLIGITSFRLKDSSGNVVYGYGYSVPLRVVQTFLQENT